MRASLKPGANALCARYWSNGLRFARRSYSATSEAQIPALKQKYVPQSGTYPKGFKVSATYVGVKAANRSTPDLTLFVSEQPCTAAAVFTKNKFQAAPVTFSRAMLQRRANENVRAVVVNSGCANAVTGKGGLADAQRMGDEIDRCLGPIEDDKGGTAIVMSTGVIGQRLPIQKIVTKIPIALDAVGSTHEHWLGAAKAICTTDTFPKLLSRTFQLPSAPSITYSIAGMTKGAGMIHPNMATLLGIIATDVPVSSTVLPKVLRQAMDKSFNSITIDGDTSTNDTVTILANGAAGGTEISRDDTADYEVFQTVLSDFATDLAKLVVRDGEGATKFVTIRVSGAASELGARMVASTIARSPLVKTALYGKDANWGRILCATGYALISEPGSPATETSDIDPARTSVSLLPNDGSAELKLLVNGEPEVVNEARAAEILENEDVGISVHLGTGQQEATYYTCDFSHEYVTINGDYRT